MTVNELRRKNLRALIAKHGGVSKLARDMGYSNPSFLSQMAGPKPTREITEKSARKLEQAIGLVSGALDRDLSAPAPGLAPTAQQLKAPRASASAGVQLDGPAAMVADVIRLVGDACDAEHVAPSMSKFADVVAIVYQDAMGGAQPTEDRVRMLARLLK